jgi:hypothetical protein
MIVYHPEYPPLAFRDAGQGMPQGWIVGVRFTPGWSGEYPINPEQVDLAFSDDSPGV